MAHPPHAPTTIPADDADRELTLARSDDPNVPHIGFAGPGGQTVTILVAGKDTAGRFCVRDVYVPPGAGAEASPPRFRGDVVGAGGRSRGDLPGEKEHHPNW